MYSTAPYEWVVSHIGAIIAWGTFLAAGLFAFYRFIVVCYRAARAFATIEQRVLDGEKTLYTVATNHLPHLQLELETSNKHLQSLRDEVKELADSIRFSITKD